MRINCCNCKKPIDLGQEICPHCYSDTMQGEIFLPRAKRQYRDRFLWPLIMLPSLVLLAFDIYISVHIDQEIEALLLGALLSFLWLLLIAALGLFFLWHQLRKMTISLLLGLVCWLVVTPMLLRLFPVGDCVHLWLEYPKYKAQIEASPGKRLTFNWGVTGFSFSASSERTLIYDPTDKLPEENKVKDAKLQQQNRYVARGHEHFNPWLITRPLFGHFYLVEEWH